ncbi:ras guanine nucleotide exchange factor B-like [Octopus sinensis]|uniref:Ras guanine nucleotide exchange factor B-like n=1 Tax=Octopus sinensis TaxID=2607531 RepID=A0A7E6FJW0_9MOLL|nr:ras guanine nucleotide exchange factor B-like [Octopus sinensis]XP_036367979.1 ras guanine nucleotide exchange factor B-like [Octopus sinensis]
MTIMENLKQSQSQIDISVSTSTPKCARPKKKGALSKLVEKKRRDSLSEVSSDAISVQSMRDDLLLQQLPSTISTVTNTASMIEVEHSQVNCVPQFQEEIREQVHFRNGILTQDSSTDDISQKHNNSISTLDTLNAESLCTTKPSQSSTFVTQPNNQGHTLTRTSSGTLLPKQTERFVSDTNSHPFRHFKVATEDSRSLKSARSSPFQPKPPVTPRRSPSLSSVKQENDSNSLPYEHKIQRQQQEEAQRQQQELQLKEQQQQQQQQRQQQQQMQKEILQQPQNKGENIKLPYLSNKENSDELINQSELTYPKKLTLSPELRHIPSWQFDYDSSDFSSTNSRINDSPSCSMINNNLRRLSPLSSPIMASPYNRNSTLRGIFKSEPTFNVSPSVLSTFSSTSALPAITIEKARSRSFLFGNINSGTSLLGNEELQRYFPNRKVKLFIGSWNMGESKDITTRNLEDFILPESCELVQDIYVIGTQENALNKRQWEITLQETLGPSYVLFHSASLGSLHIAIFMRRDLIWFCSIPEEDSITTRAVTMIKTKGSVAVALTFFGTSMLFIISHFTASYQKMADRMSDYEKTIRDLRLPKGSQLSGSKDVTSRYDSVFWMGDFNFRINGTKCPLLEEMVVKDDARPRPNFEKILQSDQLMGLLNEGKIFKGFQEGRISFQPTYKFDVKSLSEDVSEKAFSYHKLRTPSYTDRILFRSRRKNIIVCTDYNSVMNINLSDHKPVYGVFEVSLRPGRDTMALAAGKFNREVYIEANRRRAENQFGQPVNDKSSSVCAIQ